MCPAAESLYIPWTARNRSRLIGSSGLFRVLVELVESTVGVSFVFFDEAVVATGVIRAYRIWAAQGSIGKVTTVTAMTAVPEVVYPCFGTLAHVDL